ncbi:hypothetical protein Hamer_G003226 [Homarus americanus]|uniref:Uncharacterized protein n=1 Tax=Homarus americanus TaxID=6706 RepID=A0A8J5N7Z5_HOMAM|nr:hypothetical protein Hamer_G003226 [Homarus americanus]
MQGTAPPKRHNYKWNRLHALETDIRQEEELAIQEITCQETSSPLQQITRVRTTNTDRQQTHDHSARATTP